MYHIEHVIGAGREVPSEPFCIEFENCLYEGTEVAMMIDNIIGAYDCYLENNGIIPDYFSSTDITDKTTGEPLDECYYDPIAERIERSKRYQDFKEKLFSQVHFD